MDSPSKAAGEKRGWWMEFGMTSFGPVFDLDAVIVVARPL
jgi:hypothetical protein